MVRNGQIEKFESFLNEDRFPFNSECEIYFVVLNKRLRIKSTIKNSKIRFFSYLEFLCQNKLLAAASIFICALKLFSIFQSKRIGLQTIVSDIPRLMRDQVITQYIKLLCRYTYRIKYLIGTNSYLSSGLPPIFHSDRADYNRVLLWYSINSILISKTEMAQKTNWHPDFRDFIDAHFVWDEYQKLELEAQGAKGVQVKGSMVFMPISGRNAFSRKHSQPRILFFEVAPHHTFPNSFYSARSSILTLTSLVSLRELPIEHGVPHLKIMVKPKRQYSSSVDRDYVDFITELRDSGKIDLVKSDCNLYEEISKADLVLAPPFSSPCVIAKEMQVPSYFFLLADSEWKLPKEMHGIRVLREFPQLVSVAKELFKPG